MPVGYGLSETSSFLTGLPWTTPRDVFRTGTYGRLLPGNELRVIEPETGRVLGPDAEGELIVRGPTLMEHYVKRTRIECFDADGFYHTGDFGSYDDHGYVYWAGRGTEMIKTGGANVSPAEIEVQLQAYAPVKLARVVGVPDERRDEIVVLCVELQEQRHRDGGGHHGVLARAVGELQSAEARPVLRRGRDPDERKRYEGAGRAAARGGAGTTEPMSTRVIVVGSGAAALAAALAAARSGAEVTVLERARAPRRHDRDLRRDRLAAL